MAVVLAAHHELLDQRVAVKVLTATDEKAISRFSFEAQSTARLKSEHVARVMDVGTLPSGAPFMVMEYLEGCDLEELLKLNGPLPVAEAVGYVLQALEGLSQAHGLGIVHRDLKPANLFLAVHPGGGNVIKVVDFGISKSIVSRRSGNTGALTAEHSTVGSPAYMAPEQIRSSKDVDARADLWSVGVVLYELLCGQPPFPGESLGAIFSAVLEKDAPEVKTRSPRVPAALSAAVARCMKRDRTERYPDVLELARDIAPFGPPDSDARVTRIEQTLQASRARAEGDGPRTSAVRVSRGGARANDEGAARAASQMTAAHVAFSSDTPNPDAVYRGETVLSVARRPRRRTLVAIAGASGAVGVIAVVAIMKTNAPGPDSRSPASVSATPATAVTVATTVTPVSVTKPAALPTPDDLPPIAAPEATTAAAVSSLKTRPAPVPHRAASPAPTMTKKHLGLLDSPD